MTSVKQWLYELQGDSAWITEIFIIVFLTLLLALLWRRINLRLHDKFARTRNEWDDVIVVALRRPVSWAIWIIGIGYAIEVSQSNYLLELIRFDLAGNSEPIEVADVLLISLFGWFLVRFIRGGEKSLIQQQKQNQAEDKLDQTTITAISKLLRASVIVTVTLVVMQTIGISISAVLAFGGIGGIAVGFAAKDLLANFFGGLMIYLDRPFAVGDWIRSPDREIEGTVEYIGWRQTRIRTFDKRPLYIPNAVFNSVAVENPSRMTHRRIYETLGIRYQDMAQMHEIVERVKAMLLAHEEIDTSQTMIVNFDRFAPSSLDFFIYTFTKTTDWVHFHTVKQDVLLKVSEIIAELGAEVAFPTSTVHLEVEQKEGNSIGEIAEKK